MPFLTFFLRRSLGPGMLLEDILAVKDGEWCCGGGEVELVVKGLVGTCR